MEKEVLQTSGAPKAIGPYSQGIRAGGLLFLSGQIPLDPVTGQIVEGDVGAQTDRVMDNLKAILGAAGLGFGQVVKATLYLTDLADYAQVNEVYARRFVEAAPARSTVQVAALPRGARVEIDLIAVVA
jgi:2-iminobutanoate/2-iminopropanoate deaminase